MTDYMQVLRWGVSPVMEAIVLSPYVILGMALTQNPLGEEGRLKPWPLQLLGPEEAPSQHWVAGV